MKSPADSSSYGSLQKAMGEKPDIQNGAAGSAYYFSPASPSGAHEGYYYTQPQPADVSPSDASWGEPYGQQYRKDTVVYAHHVHPAYYPAGGWHPAPPAMPLTTGAYYGHHPAYHAGPPPPAMYPVVSQSSSLSNSFGSSWDVSPESKPRRQGRGRGRRGSRGGSGGNPPNRGWYRYDENTSLFRMKGRLSEIGKDRDGSKFIQRRLQFAEASEVQIAFDEALQDFDALCNDVYGNYVLQGLLERGTGDMRDQIGQKLIESDVVSLSNKIYGCRLVQKALAVLSHEDVANLVLTLKGSVRSLIHDHNGNHVIQQATIKINEALHRPGAREDSAARELLLSSLDVIVDELSSDLSTHPYGCRVFQRLIEHGNDPHKARVLDCLVQEDIFSKLIDHEYGNYVVQRVLTYGRPSDKAAVFNAITDNILKLSCQKHSSNVVEMMLTYGTDEQRHQMVDEILNGYCVDSDCTTKNAAVAMCQNAYANYVCKTALEVLPEGPQRERMFSILISNLGELEASQYSKQIVLRVKTRAYRRSNYE